MTRGRPEAAAAIWRWRDRAREARTHAARLRRGALIRAAVSLAIAGVLVWLEPPIIAAVAASLGALTLVLALASPARGYAALLRAMDAFASLVGAIVAWLLLAPVFFLFFVPFRLLARRGENDRLHRRLAPEAKSYWTKRDPRSPGSLEKLY